MLGTTASSQRLPPDVAAAVVEAVEGRAKPGGIYELGGPEVRTFKEILEFVLATIDRKRMLVPLPFALAEVQAWFLQFLPKPPLTPDQVELLKSDNVVSEAAKRDGRTLEGLGITPVAMEAVAPTYLWRFRKTGQFDLKRNAAATTPDLLAPRSGGAASDFHPERASGPAAVNPPSAVRTGH